MDIIIAPSKYNSLGSGKSSNFKTCVLQFIYDLLTKHFTDDILICSIMIIIFSHKILLQVYQRDVSLLVNVKLFLYKLYCVCHLFINRLILTRSSLHGLSERDCYCLKLSPIYFYLSICFYRDILVKI